MDDPSSLGDPFEQVAMKARHLCENAAWNGIRQKKHLQLRVGNHIFGYVDLMFVCIFTLMILLDSLYALARLLVMTCNG